MKKKKGFAAWTAWLMCAALLAGLAPVRAEAAGPVKIDTEALSSLSLECDYEGAAVEGAKFQTYRVASVDEDCKFTLTEAFAGSAVDLSDPTAEAWKALVGTLEGYALRNQVSPDREGATDSAGRLSFAELPTGLYLVLGESRVGNGEKYTPMPFLISLPNWDTEKVEWVYDVGAKPKTEKESQGGEKLELHVSKWWYDEGNENRRPQSVTVELLRDGEVYESVTLNEANGWSHDWEGLDPDASWNLVEVNVPSRYTVLVSEAGTWFIVRNTYTPDTPNNPGGGNPGGGGDNPGGGGDNPGGGGDTPGTPNIPTLTTFEPEGTPLASFDGPETALETIEEDQVPLAMLPQTGLLWWPVPALSLCGMMLFLLGWGRYRKDEGNDE